MQYLFSRRCHFQRCKIYRLSLDVPMLPKSLNKSLRAHRFKNNRDNKAWDNFVGSLCLGKKPKKPLEKANLILIRHAHRMMDFDGVVGSMKPVVDALVTCGILADDSWNVTGAWQVDQKFRPKNQGPLLEIRITERES